LGNTSKLAILKKIKDNFKIGNVEYQEISGADDEGEIETAVA
jgi:hypothetical protein